MTAGGPELMTVAELLRRPADKFEELIEGVIHRREPRRMGPALAGTQLLFELMRYERGHPNTCGIWSFGLGYVVGRGPDSVLAPSIAVVDLKHDVEIERGADGFSDRVPMIPIENQDDSDDPAVIARKVAIYLDAGAREVWWVRSMDGAVTVHRPDGVIDVLRMGDTLTTQALPGFELPLSELFA